MPIRTVLALAALAGLAAAPAAPPSAPALPAFLAGSWGATIDGVAMEEHWTDAAGGVMVGMHRDVRADGRASFEYARVAPYEGGIAYLASPGGAPATPFRMTASTPERVVFENPDHDFPQRIVYWRGEHDALCARVEDLAVTHSEQWCWPRLRPR